MLIFFMVYDLNYHVATLTYSIFYFLFDLHAFWCVFIICFFVDVFFWN